MSRMKNLVPTPEEAARFNATEAKPAEDVVQRLPVTAAVVAAIIILFVFASFIADTFDIV